MKQFSENGNLSKRQLFRLYTFDLIGASTLLIPPLLSGIVGEWGLICIVISALMGYVYITFLGKLAGSGWNGKWKQISGIAWIRKLLWTMLFIHSFFLSCFSASLLARLMQNHLVETTYDPIVLLVLLVSLYAISGGIESRARVYEILFWIVLIPLVIMLLLAVRDINPLYILPVQAPDIKSLLSGSYVVFLFFTPLMYAIFLKDKLSEKTNVFRPVRRAFLVAVVLLAFLYEILLGCFGRGALQNMDWPAVTLMSTVKLEGMYWKRLDALMLAIWFFTLFALLNLCVSFTCIAGRKMIPEKKNDIWYIRILKGLVLLVFLYLGAKFFYEWEEFNVIFASYMKRVGGPFLLIWPVLALLLGLFCGCESTELENRCFPMATLIDEKEKQNVYGYAFADSSQFLYGCGNTLDRARTNYEKTLAKRVDYNHMKVLVIGQDFANNSSKMQELLELLCEKEKYPRNTLVCVVENVSLLNEFDSDTDVGTFLEEYMKNQNLLLVTTGDLIKSYQNGQKEIEIPFLLVEKNCITWERDCSVSFAKKNLERDE